MLDYKSIKTQFLFFPSFLLTIIIIFGCQSKSDLYNFNGGFENESKYNNEPSGWYATRVPKTSSFTHFALDSVIKHSGKYSVSIAIDSTHPQDKIVYNWTRTFEEFTINNKYSISGWVKTDNLLSPAFIVVQCWNAEKKMIGFFTTQRDYQIKGTSDWVLVKTDFIVPESTKEVRIRAGIASPKNNGGKVWFDDIEIE